MNIEDLREYCLSLPGVTEGTPFEKFSRGKFTILVFYVSGHMFCYFNIDDFNAVTIKCDPAEMAELKERYMAVGEPYNGDKRHWMSVAIGQDVPDDVLKAMVRRSHELVAKQYRTRK
jgi:predicted DNA-binding protein (MmcQ/YjbR family)